MSTATRPPSKHGLGGSAAAARDAAVDEMRQAMRAMEARLAGRIAQLERRLDDLRARTLDVPSSRRRTPEES